MANLSTPQTVSLFKEFAKRWQETLGSPLILLSPEGKILAKSLEVSVTNWSEILVQVSPHRPTLLTHFDQTMLSAPLAKDNRNLGYLLAPNAKEQAMALLTWGAETIMAHLEDEEALLDMTDELIGAWNQLELIYRVTHNLTLTTDLIAALQSVLQEIQKVVDTEDGFILLRRLDSFTCVTCTQNVDQNLLRSQSLLDNLIRADHVVLCEELSVCQNIWPEAPPFIENILATDLPVEEGVKAALGLINKIDEKFTAGDAKLLAALAQQVGVIIKNFLLHQDLIVEERLSRELEIAAEIQKSFLPTRLPEIKGVSLSVVSAPASEVGGDFYDFITVDNQHLTLVIGDVAGKGIPAAMLTSLTRTMLRVEAMRGEPPHRIIEHANNVLHQDLSRADSFVTVIVASIDLVEDTLSYASAGHMPAILWRADTRTADQLRATSPPIGIVGHEGGLTRTFFLNPEDTIVFYTDGITEAQAPNGEFFSINRLLKIIESNAGVTPEALQKHILSDIDDFRGNFSSRDDATLLIVKMIPQPEIEFASLKEDSTILKATNFSYPADIQYLTDISREITEACCDLPTLPSSSNAKEFVHLIELAISEICTNIIKHAYAETSGEITGCITLLDTGVQLDFYDQGASFDPHEIPQPSSDPYQLAEGGYGLHIVRQIMDVVSYDHHPRRGNHWQLIKFLTSTHITL